MQLTARIVSRRKLIYDDGADATQDRPAHVRAASAVRLVDTALGRRLVIAQDDAHFLALVDPVTFSTTSIALPPGPGGRRQLGPDTGLKKHKLDLECMEAFSGDGGDVVIALGSGSLAPRERAVVVDARDPERNARVVDCSALYAKLRALPLLRDAELNLEGMCVVGDRVTLFQRGNGAGAIDATVTFDARAFRAFVVDDAGNGAVPDVLDVQRHDLGVVNGGRLTFTDACARRDGSIVFTAAAEASPNAVDDGEVVGCALGVLGHAPCPILDENGERFLGKPEGLALDPDDEKRAWIVVDPDNPVEPALLLTLSLS